MPLAFSPQANAKIDEILGRYPTRHAALIPTLWVAQREFGTVTRDVMELVAARLDVPASKVISTATFYTMFNKKPVGRWHVQVCKNISCYLRNSDALYPVVRERLGIGPGETSDDGNFTFSEVECLAACGRAPVVQINETYHEWQTPERFGALLDELKAKALIAGARPIPAPPVPQAEPAVPDMTSAGAIPPVIPGGEEGVQ